MWTSKLKIYTHLSQYDEKVFTSGCWWMSCGIFSKINFVLWSTSRTRTRYVSKTTSRRIWIRLDRKSCEISISAMNSSKPMYFPNKNIFITKWIFKTNHYNCKRIQSDGFALSFDIVLSWWMAKRNWFLTDNSLKNSGEILYLKWYSLKADLELFPEGKTKNKLLSPSFRSKPRE